MRKKFNAKRYYEKKYPGSIYYNDNSGRGLRPKPQRQKKQRDVPGVGDGLLRVGMMGYRTFRKASKWGRRAVRVATFPYRAGRFIGRRFRR